MQRVYVGEAESAVLITPGRSEARGAEFNLRITV